MKFLYILTDCFWWYASHRVLHIWPTEHISGQRVLDLEHSLNSHGLCLMLPQPFMISFLTCWTCFRQISTRSWTFHTYSVKSFDDTSAIEYCIFDLLNMFLTQESLIMIFLNRLSDSFWCYIRHTIVHFWHNEHISGPRGLDLELSIQTHWLFLMSYEPDNSP